MLPKWLVGERQLLGFELNFKVNTLLNYFSSVLVLAIKAELLESRALGRGFQGHSRGKASSAQQSDCRTVGWVCNWGLLSWPRSLWRKWLSGHEVTAQVYSVSGVLSPIKRTLQNYFFPLALLPQNVFPESYYSSELSSSYFMRSPVPPHTLFTF